MKKRYIKWGLVVIWAVVIFVFSSQTGDMSSQNNRFIMDMFNRIGINLDTITGGLGNLIIRKAAHFTEYFILYLLFYNAFIDDFYRKPALIISIIATALYAASDEFHQSFVGGRGPAVLDVMIDTSGGIAAALILNIKECIIAKRKSIPSYYRSKD